MPSSLHHILLVDLTNIWEVLTHTLTRFQQISKACENPELTIQYEEKGKQGNMNDLEVQPFQASFQHRREGEIKDNFI